MVKNPPANAGDMGSSPGPGRSHVLQSHKARVPQLLSPCATTTETRKPRARAPQQEKPRNEKPAHRNKEQPPLATTRESLRAATKTQHSQK